MPDRNAPGHQAYLRFRPDHPDVERIAEITRTLDWMVDHGVGRVDQQQAFEQAAIETGVDIDSLSYLAVQRAMRACGVVTNADLTAKQAEVTLASSAWLEGFMVGARFKSAQREGV